MDGNIRKIGRVILDYTDYPGEDYYSEGPLEDALLEIVRNHPKEEFNRIISVEKQWSVLYHLSHLRGNIVDFLPIRKSHRVLEIGAGCGAVTGTIARRAGEVTCVELSQKRSMINAYRNREFGNIEIRIGNFQQIEKRLEKPYDFILLIGVLEYALSYIEAENPYLTFLKILEKHLSPGGQIVVAIENKYGMKYFAGCREDHTGDYYDGIEGYRKGAGVRTFSRAGLNRLFQQAGYEAAFYYPYPDYKLPMTIYSDAKLPSRGELTDNLRNFDGERLLAFDEGAAFDEALKDGYFPFFSNSFLALLRKGPRPEEDRSRTPLYSKHSNERDPAYQIRTDIEEERNHRKVVVKYPLTAEAVDHLERMAYAYGEMKKEFAGTSFRPNVCRRMDGPDGRLERLEFEFLTGRSMSDSLDLMLKAGRPDECVSAIRHFAEALRRVASRRFWATREFASVFSVTEVPGEHSSMVMTDLDFVFTNLIFNKGWNIIDYEWTFEFPVPVDFLIYRAVFYYLASASDSGLDESELYRRLGITEEQQKVYYTMELSFQQFIAGRNLSLTGMHAIFGGNLLPLRNALRLSRQLNRPEHPMIYYDRGNGFHEEDALVLLAERDEEDRITVDTVIPQGCTAVRVDPVEHPCMVRMERVTMNQVSISSCRVNGTGISEHVILFDTPDPQIFIGNTVPGTRLHLEYHIAALDPRFFRPLAFEFAVPRENEGSRWSRLIHGSRPEFIEFELPEEEGGQV